MDYSRRKVIVVLMNNFLLVDGGKLVVVWNVDVWVLFMFMVLVFCVGCNFWIGWKGYVVGCGWVLCSFVGFGGCVVG